MTVKNWDANAGTDATNVSLVNSALSGDAVSVVVINGVVANSGGPAIQYLAAAASEGALGIRIIPQASDTHLRWEDTAPTSMKCGARVRFRLNGSGVASAVATLFNVRSISDVNIYDVQITTSRVLSARNRTYSAFAGQTYVLTMGVWYEIEAYVHADTATTGRVTYKLYLAGETTPVVTFDSGGNDDLGTVQPAQLRLGRTTTATTGLTSIDYDAVRFGTLPIGDEWGPFSPPVNAGVDQTVEPWSLVSLAATGTGTWSQTAGPTVTLDIDGGDSHLASFTAPPIFGAPQDYTFAFGTDSMVVTVLAATDAFYDGADWVPYRPYVHA